MPDPKLPLPRAPQSDTNLHAVPRRTTDRILRRIWTDPRVRAWWVLAAVLGIIGSVFVTNAIHARYHEAWLIRDGVQVGARVAAADGEHIKNRPEPPYGVVELEYPADSKWPGYRPRPRVLEGRETFVTTWSILPIHVNPDDPEDWTWVDTPLPLITRMLGAIIVLPMAVLALLWTIYLLRTMLRTWRDGKLVEALMVESRHIAVAPRCRLARVTPADDNDQGIYTVFLPPSLSKLKRGDSLTILKPDGNRGKAVATGWFE